MKVNVNDFLAIGIIILSIFIFMISQEYEGLIKLTGLVGSTILIIVESFFLYQTWVN